MNSMAMCFAAGCATSALASLLITTQPAAQSTPPLHEVVNGADPTFGAPQEQALIQQPSMVRVTRTERTVDRTNDPIWDVEVLVKGQLIQRFDAVVGRANKQGVNRHIAGTEAPLPPGRYRLDLGGIAGGPYDNPELGSGLWIPTTPLFATGRSALGFHQDPSWGRLNNESGTSGCIGFRTADETRVFADLIRQHNIQGLVVTN